LQKKAWEISEKSNEQKTQVQALSLAKDCIINKLDLLTNATVVDDAIRFASNRSNEKLRSSSNSIQDDKESDYDKDQNQLEGEQSRDIATTNHVF
jgi:hypothetical protein